jgi:ribonucleoside-diphosphate reductase beta chain
MTLETTLHAPLHAPLLQPGFPRHDAVNWNRADDAHTKRFWDQNVRQFWVDEEIPLADDKLVWMNLIPEERRVFEHALGGLTLLDTEQGGAGMPLISQAVASHQQRAVLSFMGAMEHMHAKSYSSIFTTLCSSERIEGIFAWVVGDATLQAKLRFVHERYTRITDARSLYLAMCASVMLESYLFYSGFYYPLLLAGQGRLVNSGEIINLIIRDESIHGAYVGMLAQDLFATFDQSQQRRTALEATDMLHALHTLEEDYTRSLYEPLGNGEEVLRFVRYNADKAMMNLGLEPVFDADASTVNAVVLAGLRTDTKHHDFFSTKGNGYVKAGRIEALRDEDFVF